MTTIKSWFAALAIALLFGMPADRAHAQQPPAPQAANQTIAIDGDDIGGTVTSRFGPEAGVWVIAETRDLGTRFAKIAVTDERGRYVIPDLPKANYQVWVRGYGLVDSPKVAAEPGKLLDLTAVVAPNLADAAQYYPALYWAAMIKIPDKSRFPGTGDAGNGIPEAFKTQDQWLNVIKTNGCGNCHQLGDHATRYISEKLGHFESSQEAWMQRLSVGPAGHNMVETITRLMTPDGGHLAALADWTDPHPAAAGRHRAQFGRHGARLAGPQALSARSDDDRPAQADRQRQWPDLRRHRTQQQRAAGARPGAQHENDDRAAVPRQHAEFGARQPGGQPVALLGHGAGLGHQGQRAQPDDGSGRASVLHGADPLAQESTCVLLG